MKTPLENVLEIHRTYFHPVVNTKSGNEKLIHVDFSASNKDLSQQIIGDVNLFSAYVNQLLSAAGATYGIGGYQENRSIYSISDLFNDVEPRTIHLGIDIWGPAGTKVYVPLGGTVHSFAFNHQQGDYGATIILQHQLDSFIFYTLYGHLSLNDLAPLKEGKYVSRGELLGHFGNPAENGNWPPHLHFQIIRDLRMNKGDYPGVCKPSETAHYFANCPNPDLILQLMQFTEG